MDTELICKNLQSEERFVRQTALKDLIKYCNDSCDLISVKELTRVYDECYLFILKCYSDKFESCREMACNAITEFMKKMPKNDYYLQYIIETIALRIGQKEIQEKSEEMRLIYLNQLNFLINKYRIENKNDYLLKSYDAIINIILKTLGDPYPSVQKESSYAIKILSEATPSFHYRAEILAKPLYSLLSHKHSANRIAAIEALGIVCLNIYTNNDIITEIIMGISPLVMDSMPLVRKECGKVGCLWLLQLKDRYSLFERILPIVLCCLNDDSPDVRECIEKLWIKCGTQYFEENENELNKMEIIFINTQPENYSQNIQRPTLGCRAMVQRSLRCVKSIMYETSDWKEEVRLHSLKLLWQVALHGEARLSGKFADIYPDLCKSCVDPDTNCAKMAMEVAELLGKMLPYDDWFDFAFDYLEKYPNLGNLKCFYYIYLNSKNGNNQNDILKLAMLLTEKFSNNLKVEVQKYLIKFVDLFLEKYDTIQKSECIEETMEKMKLENYNEFEKYLYHILIKVMAVSCNESNYYIIDNQNLLLKLTRGNGECIPELHKMYLKSVIESFDSLDVKLNEFSEPILLLYGIIIVCGFQKAYLQSLKDCIKNVWEYGASDGKIKILSAISIAMLKWNKSISNDIENISESTVLLSEFINDIVEPHLIWKPGTIAESLRSMATATLCAMTQGAAVESLQVLPKLAGYFKNLIEDRVVATRAYAIKCFINFGPIGNEHLKPVAYALLECIDDPSREVREWSIRVLCKLDIREIDENHLIIWHNFVKATLKLLFIHFDGSDLKLNEIIKETIVTFGRQYPDFFKEAYKTAFEMNADKEGLREIQTCVVQS